MARRMLGRKNSTKDIKAIRALSKVTDTAVACRVYNNADITHTSTGNWQALTFNSELRDATAMHSTTGDTNRIVFSLDGWYMVTGHLVFSNSSQTGMRGIMIREGGDTIIAVHGQDAQSSQYTWMSISTIYYFDAGEYIELLAYQSSGGNLDIISTGKYSPEFAVAKFPFKDRRVVFEESIPVGP